MPTLRQLRYVVELARHGSFGEAASACHVTQPALSMQLKLLEAELGARLIDRAPGNTTLTEHGLEVVARCEKILADVRDLVDLARHGNRTLVGNLRLGIIPSVAPYLLPRLLPVLAERFPGLEPELRETQTATLIVELAQGRLDVLLLALPVEGTGIETSALFEDEFYLAAPAGRAPRKGGARELLRRDRLLLLEEGHCLRDQALQFCRMSSREERRVLGATSLTTIIQMVAAGHGVTLLPAICAAGEVHDGRVRLIAFGGDAPRRVIGLAWRRGTARRHDFVALGEAVAAVASGIGPGVHAVSAPTPPA
jgi:LysR family hydrogen peroxide-inducible transcriptional activator